ncbi:hypothetical protein PENTCL1PPCAC_17279, partial [Pristionchus entomophagus]
PRIDMGDCLFSTDTMRHLLVSFLFFVSVLGEISDVPSTPGPLSPTKAGKKARQWPCSGGCGGYYGLSGSGLGGYSPYMGGLGGLGMNPLLSGGMGSAGACMDLSPQCATYAATGQCASNPFLIRRLCPLSCGTGCAGYQYGMGGLGGLGGYGGVGGMGGLGTGLGTYGAYNPMLGGGMYPGAYGSGLYGGGLGTGLGGLGTGMYGNNLYGNGLYGGLGGVGLGRSIYETGIYRKPNADVPVTSIKAISDSLKANRPVAALPSLPALPKRFY